MTVHTLLKPRHDGALPGRVSASAAAVDEGAGTLTEDFAGWLAEQGRAARFRVDRIPFAELDGWSFDSETGNLAHRSGRFFTVEGLDVVADGPRPRAWQQPIMVQPEVAILGVVAKEFDGVLHFLMQAKMEPGNPGLIQISPTVQATPSNYTRVHKGADVNYIDYFIEPGRGRILVDVLQSEVGSRFHHKANRNMIVEVTGDVPLRDQFCWLTAGQIGAFLRRDNVMNMDSRSIFSCVPMASPWAHALHSDTDLLSWFTGVRSRRHVRATRIPLAKVSDWARGEWSIEHADERYFRIAAVEVEAGNREVTHWSQPLCEPIGLGVSAFVACRFEGVPHLLAHARPEAGFLDTVEFGPTVQYTPEEYAGLPDTSRPLFADLVRDAPPSRIRYDAVLAEEGGRLLNAESRYRIVEIDETEVPSPPPPDYQWVTPGQLSSLVRHGHYVNVQARSLLAAFTTGAVDF
ncbi:NDP-hexose 2,3-dehydratase family protein [Actinomadura sp. DC4]|uniref:NDP-hexose 2,3-dehydratase family protein n=1 Tax=Actinomadura sp. DC4 TaxID=3055069 RepID=UPI0025B0FC98|nr:NDP-hexose 2,3-dehydratase family protein [Actinomadura sp. DC4]MDN3354715.1 NDP-hexose 2,3-dehydratase family protein [Actinomadura sp. DC4]